MSQAGDMGLVVVGGPQPTAQRHRRKLRSSLLMFVVAA